MPKISVLIPIYNVEQYIERCARSLFEQSIKDIEYIFVNDCTLDKSIDILYKIIDDYPERKSQIKILHHDRNHGLATTRNTALKIAQGEYIVCCDSDDYVERNAYEEMYEYAIINDADFVATDFFIEDSMNCTYVKQNYLIDKMELLKQMLIGSIHTGNWNKLIKRSIFLTNSICYPDGINMWEDMATIIPICYYSSKIIYLPKAFYHYVQYNSNSYSQNINERSLDNMIEVMNRLSVFIKNNGLYVLNDALDYRKISVKSIVIQRYRGKKQLNYSKLFPEINNRFLFNKYLPLKNKIALCFTNYKMLPIYNIMLYFKKIIMEKNY